MASARRLIPLLPAAHPSPVTLSLPESFSVSKRSAISSACESCRKQKTKCDGSRPCSACHSRGTPCNYKTLSQSETHAQALKRKFSALEERGSTLEQLLQLLRDRSDQDALDALADIRKGVDPEEIVRRAGHGEVLLRTDRQHRATVHQEIVELLMNLPENDAQSILSRLRARASIETIVNHVKAGDILLQMAVAPETRLRYEFPYRSGMPESYTGNNPYLNSLIYESSSLYPTGKVTANRTSDSSDRAHTSVSKAHQEEYLKPFHAAKVIDPRLADVKLSTWTAVCDDDALMRTLLREWLHCEYQFTAAFQKDLLLEDLATCRDDFCSSLLVNIVLGYACVCHPQFTNRAEYWKPQTLLYGFLSEAKRLWELEALEPRLTTVQAGILFNVFYNLCGLDEVGQAYRIQALALAHQMQLFHNDASLHSQRMCHGRAFTAWALYNWETLVGFSFLFAPLLKEPPEWQLPDPSQEGDWYGEIWVQYPLSNRLVSSGFGQTIRARSQFRVIMNEACQAAYSKDSVLTLPIANELLSRLEAWYCTLTGALQPGRIVLPGHLQLHMYYHHLILTIFEPLAGAITNNQEGLQQIVSNARKYLQTLVRLYYLRHGYEAMDLFIVIPLMLAASDCIDAISNQTSNAELETLRSTLILAAKGLDNQRRNHYLAEALFRVIRGRMRPAEVALLRRVLNVGDEELHEKPNMAQAVRSNWPVSIVRSKEELGSRILTSLVENYAHLNIQESHRNGDTNEEQAEQYNPIQDI